MTKKESKILEVVAEKAATETESSKNRWYVFCLFVVALGVMTLFPEDWFEKEQKEMNSSAGVPVEVTPDITMGPEDVSQVKQAVSQRLLALMPVITQVAQEKGLDPAVLVTVAGIESCFHQYVVSSAGAIGYGQVMPFNFDTYQPFDQVENLRAAADVWQYMSQFSTDKAMIAAAYNAGQGIITTPWENWPVETQAYYNSFTTIFSDLSGQSDLVSAFVNSQGFDIWLGALNGHQLCELTPSDSYAVVSPEEAETWLGEAEEKVASQELPSQAVTTHIIQAGESLSSIEAYYAQNFDITWTWQDLANFNNITDPTLIQPGQVLNLPN